MPMPPLPDDRPIARTTVEAIVRSLGYEPGRTVAVRIEHDVVTVDVVETAQPVYVRTVTHPIREDR